MNNYQNDCRTILTLDAGGTNFVFSAIKNAVTIVTPYTLPACAHSFKNCLANLVLGFEKIIEMIEDAPDAISFAFPGPADYPNGIISNDLPNFPAFQSLNGFPLADYLKEKFNIPVYINNDGNLYALGEAIFGFLPTINNYLKSNNNTKQYRNLLGITLGTGFGGGIVIDGKLINGENSCAAEIFSLSGRENKDWFVEETLSIRGIQRLYKKLSKEDNELTPYHIYKIAIGEQLGNKIAAIKTYEIFGEVLGDAVANCIALLDCLVVIGGGIIGSSQLFIPSFLRHLNGKIGDAKGEFIKRIPQIVYNLDDENDIQKFVRGNIIQLESDYYSKKINYDNDRRLGIALSKMGANEAIAKGAYFYALQQLEQIN